MAPTTPSKNEDDTTIYALINYEDPYVQPLILAALSKHLPSSSYKLIASLSELPSPQSRLLQFVQYESIDWDHLMSHPTSSLANAYVIRKALIRKHYLSTTIANWCTKYPDSVLKKHVKPSVEFEVDYAEFLDDALVEAYELRESWGRNEEIDQGARGEEVREWWILKPGMSDRGQGIRLFSSEEELTSIFEEWDPESDDEEEEEDDARSDDGSKSNIETEQKGTGMGDGIITSQLRHFIAQPYIHPPLLLPPPQSSTDQLRKFHIRTYVLATGALKIHIYRPMLALFAAHPYLAPSPSTTGDMSAHLTNTCLQDTGDREGSVGLFWDLPDDLPTQPTSSPPSTASADWKSQIFAEICAITAETFEAAARGMSVHFQPLPNAFEVFGLDFMVGIEKDGGLRTWLLEVNAFPDFRQTGGELQGLVRGLMEGVVGVGVGGFFGVEETIEEAEGMVEVLNVDLGRK